MNVALVSIGHSPSLALRNIKAYCLAHEDVAGSVTFALHDYDLVEFREWRRQSSQQWSFVTRFDEAVSEICEPKPSLVAFTCYLWNIELSLHLAHLVKRILPEAVIVLGGPDAGPQGIELLENHSQIDIIVKGDGEIPFLGLVRKYLRDPSPDLGDLPSLGHRVNNEIILNSGDPGTVDMSLLTNVYESDLPSPQELSRWSWPHLHLETLRGCPYSCSYCMYGKTKLNEKDPDAAVEEISRLLQHGAVIYIIDPTFTTYRKRAKYILRRLSERSHRGQLSLEVYPDSIDEEMADLLGLAPVTCIGIGFQTLSKAGLKAVRRPRNLERFEQAVQRLRERRIHFYVDIIYGLPGTTVEDFLATVDYLDSLDITQIMMYRLLGLPGSPMMEDVERFDLVFSQRPPYELLSSSTFTLKDIMFCERFRHAHDQLLAYVPAEEARQLSGGAGISKTVGRFMHIRKASPDEPVKSWVEQLRMSLLPPERQSRQHELGNWKLPDATA